ncbi:hypothetical protein DMUE_1617 [Dictyocoela muelleri]|nr:hypothetical protein DMUE_1617 [Dictyocoela muelleri]
MECLRSNFRKYTILTNNDLESFNSQLNLRLNTRMPSFYNSLKILISIQHENERRLNILLISDRNKFTLKKYEEMKKIWLRYKDEEWFVYLKNISNLCQKR